jgi:hypothetical protein
VQDHELVVHVTFKGSIMNYCLAIDICAIDVHLRPKQCLQHTNVSLINNMTDRVGEDGLI